MCEEHRRAKRGLRLVSFCVPNCDQISKTKSKSTVTYCFISDYSRR
nr:MAG TPA_asm: hypothetical protein [Caudoviricetes sp.]